MPRVSNWQDTLKWVRENLYLSILLDSSDSKYSDNSSLNESMGLGSPLIAKSDQELDSFFDFDAGMGQDPTNVDDKPPQWLELHSVLDSERYWLDRTKRFQAKEFSDTFFFEVMPDHLFRQMTRMSKAPFANLVFLVEDHPIFHNSSTCPQTPVALQLATCLDRLGHSGKGVCLKHTLLLWGISHDSCVNFTQRCMTALHARLGDNLKWPLEGERTTISSDFAKKEFHGCMGLVDGTTFPLAQKPARYGEVYYERKCRYSLNAQIVCDNNRRIIFIYSGAPGSCSDLTCLKRSVLWGRIHGDSLFGPGQYVLGDSGYVNAPHMVCSFKMTMHNKDREDFNFCIAKCRVVNEHTIGVLKNRWFLLKELRTQLNKNKDHGRICKWILCCALLHNYVHDAHDPWTEEDMGPNPMDPPIEVPLDPSQNRQRSRHSITAGGLLLERVKNHCLWFNRQPGGCLRDETIV